MFVDTAISDLFFNTEHEYDSELEDYVNLPEEATDFLSSLDRLGVITPTVEVLMNDFRERL